MQELYHGIIYGIIYSLINRHNGKSDTELFEKLKKGLNNVVLNIGKQEYYNVLGHLTGPYIEKPVN